MNWWRYPLLVLKKAWLQVWPSRGELPQLPKDARTYALEALFDYLASVHFSKPDGNGGVTTFEIPRCQMYIDPPPGNRNIHLPAIAALPAPFNLDDQWLGRPIPVEDTWERYGEGTILVEFGEYFGQITLDIWTGSGAERTAILRAFETSIFWTEDGPMYLRLPNYFDRVAVFEYLGHTRMDTTAYKDLWQLQVRLSLRIQAVDLVQANTIHPHLDLDALGPTE